MELKLEVLAPWTNSETVARSGIFIYLIHTQLPGFMAIENHFGDRFSSQEALQRSVDLTRNFIVTALTSPEPSPKVQAIMKMHDRYGVPQEWMNFIAGIITAAPAIVATTRTPYSELPSAYHTYVSTRFAESFGLALPDQSRLEEELHGFFTANRGITEEGIAAQQLLTATYPDHVKAVLAAPGYQQFVQ